MYLKTAIEMGHKVDNFDPNVDLNGSFKRNFKNLKKEFKNFGSDSIGYEEWWTRLVKQVLSEASNNKLTKDDCENVAKRLIKKFETEECWGKFNKTDELIMALRKENKVLGVISNFDTRLHNLLNNMELYDFHFEVTSYEAKIEKPDPLIFHHALREGCKVLYPPNVMSFINVMTPQEALHIGNELENDVEGAKKAGWASVLIAENGDFKSIEEFYKALNEDWLDL